MKLNPIISAESCRVRAKTIMLLCLLSLLPGSEITAQSAGIQRTQIVYGQIPRTNISNNINNKVELNISYDFRVNSNTRRLKLIVAMPPSIENRQKILSTKTTPRPNRTYTRDGNTYAEFTFDRPAKQITIDISIQAELYRYDLYTAKRNPQIRDFDTTQLSSFLRNEQYIEKDDEVIQSIAKDITGRTDEEIVKNIFDYVLDTLEYVKRAKKSLGAVSAIRYGKGDCTEYSDLFAAICRAKGIPARTISGYALGNTSPIRHNWVEVYLKAYGWVPFEISGSDVPSNSLRNRLFSTMPSQYFYFSNIRSDPVLDYNNFCVYRYWGDKVRLIDTISCKYIRLDE